MTDPISNLGRSTAQLNTGSERVKNTRADNAVAPAADKAAKANNDELILSATTESALANAEFDAAKVARIKEAIEQGNYPIDAKKVAESFASLESLIG